MSAFVRNPLEGIPRSVYERDAVAYGGRVWITAPALIREVLLDGRERYRKLSTIRLLGPLLGRGILTSEGAEWKWQRQAAAPMFRQQDLLRLVPAFVHAALRAIERWRAAPGVQSIDRDMTRATFEVISSTLLPSAEGALAPLLAREPGLREADLAIVLEPTANAVQAGCLGNLDATWTFHGRSGHSARPWLADNAIERAARGVEALAAIGPQDREHAALRYRQVVSVTRLEAGVASNVIPGVAVANVNFRYDPALSAEEAERELRGWCEPHGEVEVRGVTPGALPPIGNALADALARASGSPMEPKQAWTPVAELAAAGVDAVNLGPGDPAYAHRTDERVAIEALVRCHELLRGFLCG